METTQETDLKSKLIELLEKAKVDYSEWFEETAKINDICNELDFIISFDWVNDWVDCSYYSMKIHKRIIIAGDISFSQENFAELAEVILECEKEAQELESKLSVQS